MSRQEGLWGPHPFSYVAHTTAMRPGVVGSGASAASILACGSFVPESANFVELLSISHESPQTVQGVARLPHYYPPSRVRWSPSSDVLLTSGDYIRVWNASGQLLRLLRHESHDANPRGLCTPITSVDAGAGQSLVSCDAYGICTLWDAEAGAAVSSRPIDLGQPLCDVAFGGPGGLLAAAGDRGDVFLIDPRQPENVHVLGLGERIGGPARLAWSPSPSGALAVAWQGEQGGLAVYSGARKGQGQLLKTNRGQHDVVADLQWSPTNPDFMCSASEGEGVEVWRISGDRAVGGPCFCWQPRAGEVCTSLALGSRPGRDPEQLVMLATMPAHPVQGGNVGSLWIAGLPNFTQAPEPLQGSAIGDAASATMSPPTVAVA